MAKPISLEFSYKDKRWADATAELQAFYGILNSTKTSARRRSA